MKINIGIKVFVKNDEGIFRRTLNEGEYTKNEKGQIILPPNHYSKGYIERIIDDVVWENYPLYTE